MNETERAALLIEDRVWSPERVGEKDAAILRLGMTPVRHAQIVMGLLEREDVEAEMPALVHRLRRLKQVRRTSRTRIGCRTGYTATGD